MTTATNTTDGRAVGPEGAPELLNVGAVAGLLGCSKRHIYRLSDTGRMPRPLKVGALVRWRRADVLSWIDGGCQVVRVTRGAR